MITLDQVKKEIGEIVAAAGEDYIYNPPELVCKYFYNGEPSCIVGHWLARHGITEVDYKDNTLIFINARRNLDLDIAGDAALFLSKVQFRQDNGDSWGEAYQLAVAWSNRNPAGSLEDSQ